MKSGNDEKLLGPSAQLIFCARGGPVYEFHSDKPSGAGGLIPESDRHFFPERFPTFVKRRRKHLFPGTRNVSARSGRICARPAKAEPTRFPSTCRRFRGSSRRPGRNGISISKRTFLFSLCFVAFAGFSFCPALESPFISTALAHALPTNPVAAAARVSSCATLRMSRTKRCEQVKCQRRAPRNRNYRHPIQDYD